MTKIQLFSLLAIVLASYLLTVDWKAVDKSLQWGTDSRIYFYTNSIRGPYTYGLVINSTIVEMSYYSAFKISNLESATYIVPNIFDVLPRHEKKIDDPNVSVARATDGDFATYLLVNGTKWRFNGGANSTYNYGIDTGKIIYANYTYLDAFPTTYYLY